MDNAGPDVVAPKDRAAWRRWLARNHARPGGVWLSVRKKGSPAQGVTYEEAILEALCFGWIDSTANPVDDSHYRLWLAPRKPKSVWSARNKARIERLVDEGLMTQAGLAKIEAAKTDGSWTALDELQDLTVPDDLAEALEAAPPARANFDAFPPGTRRQILYWIRSAKRPQTRATRVDETARRAAENVRVNEWLARDRA